jgi:hypothetical protein
MKVMDPTRWGNFYRVKIQNAGEVYALSGIFRILYQPNYVLRLPNVMVRRPENK